MVRRVPTRSAESCAVQLYNPSTSARFATTANPENVVITDLHCTRYRSHQQESVLGGAIRPANPQEPRCSSGPPASSSSPGRSSSSEPAAAPPSNVYTGAERRTEDRDGNPTGPVPGLGVKMADITRQADLRREQFLQLYDEMERAAVLEQEESSSPVATFVYKNDEMEEQGEFFLATSRRPLVRTTSPHTTTWRRDHLHLRQDMNTCRFRMCGAAQRMIFEVMTILVDAAYELFGKVPDESWDCYTLMFRNGFTGRDDRKPITPLFQEWCESVYCPVLWTLLFSKEGWNDELKKHYAQFKTCTVLVCEDTGFWGKNIFHMHIDGKIGIFQVKTRIFHMHIDGKKRMNRLLFSTSSIAPLGAVLVQI